MDVRFWFIIAAVLVMLILIVICIKVTIKLNKQRKLILGTPVDLSREKILEDDRVLEFFEEGEE